MNNLFYAIIIAGMAILGLKSITKKDVSLATDLSGIDSKTSICLKGVAAMLIALHHAQQQGLFAKYYVIFGYIGFVMVGLFFFLSGYGLAYGYINKKNYLSNFLYKHLLSIYIPYWFVIIFKIGYAVQNGEKLVFSICIRNLLGFGEHWFVTAIILFYIFFYFVCRFIKSDFYKPIVLLLLVITYMIVCSCVGLGSSYTASSLCFVSGVWYYLQREKFISIIRNKHILLAIGFLFLFIGRLALAYLGIGNVIFHILTRNLISCSFVLFIMALLLKYEFYHDIWFHLGKMSYELYLVHIALLPLIGKVNFLFFIVATILGSIILRSISLRIKHALLK